MDFRSAKELFEVCEKEDISIGEAMLRREMMLFGVTREQANEQMARAYAIMKNSAKQAITTPVKSIGGLIGGESEKITRRSLSHAPVCGALISKAMAYAMGTLEVNSSMGLIVAAPTAGSCGVVPGVFLAIQEEFNIPDEKMIEALFNAAAIGYLIMRNATVAGAEGGCQAEVGSACAMAACAIAELMGASRALALDAASSTLANLLGLVCDPIAGLVEAPCQKRNAMGAANALICAEMALSGIPSTIPLDEMIEAMYRVGTGLPSELRETARGGVAATPTGARLCSKIMGAAACTSCDCQ